MIETPQQIDSQARRLCAVDEQRFVVHRNVDQSVPAGLSGPTIVWIESRSADGNRR